MIIGTTIFHDGTGTTEYMTPSFPRGGLSALFSLNVTHKSGSPTMVVKIEHKNEDETAFTELVAFSDITATGPATKDISGGIKEELRLTFTFSGGSAGNFFHLVIAAPAWRPYT